MFLAVRSPDAARARPDGAGRCAGTQGDASVRRLTVQAVLQAANFAIRQVAYYPRHRLGDKPAARKGLHSCCASGPLPRPATTPS